MREPFASGDDRPAGPTVARMETSGPYRDAYALARHWVSEVESGILHDFADVDEGFDCLYDGELARQDPAKAIDVVLAVLDEVRGRGLPPARYYSDIAADLLETTLSEWPRAVIERVERLARERADFASVLGGVWRSDIPDDIWKRICAVALPLPEPAPPRALNAPRRKRFTGSHRVGRALRRR